MRTTSMMVALAAGLSFNTLHAGTKTSGKTFSPVDIVSGFFHKGPKSPEYGGQQAPAAPAEDIDDLDALSEVADAGEEGALEDEGLDLESEAASLDDDAAHASGAESLDDDAAPPVHAKATADKKAKTKKRKGTQGSNASGRGAKKARKGKSVSIIITIEPHGGVRLEVPNARIIKGRS